MKTYKQFITETASKNMLSKYPSANHLHIVRGDTGGDHGDEHHVIKGVKGSRANAEKAFDSVIKHSAKHAGVDHEDAEEILDDIPGHHQHLENKYVKNSDSVTAVHKNIEAYGKYHGLKHDGPMVKDAMGPE